MQKQCDGDANGDRTKFYSFFFDCMIGLRADAYERKDWKTFHYCNLLHHAAAQLAADARRGSEPDYSALVASLSARLDGEGLQGLKARLEAAK